MALIRRPSGRLRLPQRLGQRLHQRVFSTVYVAALCLQPAVQIPYTRRTVDGDLFAHGHM